MLLVSACQMQALDRRTIEDFGIPGIILMENAGRRVTDLILTEFPDRLRRGVLLLIGPGNNGGDGFVIARHLAQEDVPVTILLLAAPDRFSGDALVNCRIAQRLGLPMLQCADSEAVAAAAPLFTGHGLIVDAIFGTGLGREVAGRFASAIALANTSPSPVVAVDIPSGLSADTGKALGIAVKARLTVTMGLAKIGQATWPGAEFVGELRVADIGIPRAAAAEEEIRAELLDIDGLKPAMRPRDPAGHKGTFGHLLIVAGSRDKPGAAALVARGALRTGAGLVTVGCPESARSVLAQKLTEAMTEGLAETQGGCISEEALARITRLFEQKRALALGPGLGLEPGAQALARLLLEQAELPVVADADALTALGTDHGPAARARGPRILTPHPGEMARLLGVTTSEVQADRIASAKAAALSTRAVVVLKGARTVVAAPDGRLAINPTGNPGMGTGGMGDVLTGIIGGLLAQGHDPWTASRLGVFFHGMAGDAVARDQGRWGYLATEVADRLPQLFSAHWSG